MELSQWGNNYFKKQKCKNARVVFLVHDTSSQCDALPVKFYEYIPYGLGVMARIEVGRTYGRTDRLTVRRTDVRDG